MIMFLFQRRTICLKAMVCLLLASVGLGGSCLCVKQDGELLLNSFYVRGHSCDIRCSGASITTSGVCQEKRRSQSSAHEGCVSCFKVPLVMVPSSRSARLTQVPLTSSTELRSPLYQTVSALLLYSGPCRPIPLDSPLLHPSFKSLLSTILLI